MYPNSSGWNWPFSPEMRACRKMYVTSDMTGMYMSGLLMSSRGGRYQASCPDGPVACRLVHGLCRQGKRTRNSLFITYELVTMK